MREALALVRQDMLTNASYRTRLLFSLLGLLVSLVPLYFVAEALQPVMAHSISGQSREYFTFVLIGMISVNWLVASLNALPDAVSQAVRTGTLESLFATPISLPALVLGLTGYRLLWSLIESAVLLAFGVILGAHVVGTHAITALSISALLIAAYTGIGTLAAAVIMLFRTTGPLVNAVLLGSTLLGGVYFPTHVIPSWLHHLSVVVPLTYGLRALRRTLEGRPFTEVRADVAVLTLMTTLLLATGVLAFHRAVGHARRNGTLAHY